jgi:hypothetical protein
LPNGWSKVKSFFGNIFNRSTPDTSTTTETPKVAPVSTVAAAPQANIVSTPDVPLTQANTLPEKNQETQIAALKEKLTKTTATFE